MQYVNHQPPKFFSILTLWVPAIFLALGFLVLIAGCDSSNVITAPIPPQPKEITNSRTIQPSVIDGRVVFEDIDEFRAFIGSLIDKSDSYLDSVQASIAFVSLRSDTERLAEDLEKEIEEIEIVEDPFFATVLNPEGEFQVGEMVYRITKNYVYRIPESDAHQLSSISLRYQDQVVLNHKTNHIPHLEVFEVERSDLEPANKSELATGRKTECSAYFHEDPDQGRRRVKGQAWFTNWVVYMSATTELESQRKGWFRWYRTSIAWITLDAGYSITQTFTPVWGGYEYSETTTDSYSHTKYDASEIRKNLTWGVSANGVVRVTGWIESTYTGHRNLDGRTVSCSLTARK